MSSRERTTANEEAKLLKAQKTTDEAKAVVAAERDATRAKTPAQSPAACERDDG
jgi:hypothetical protein